MTLSYDDLIDLAGHRTITDVPCPLCGPGRRSPANRKRKVLRVWHTEHGLRDLLLRSMRGEGLRASERGENRAPTLPRSG